MTGNDNCPGDFNIQPGSEAKDNGALGVFRVGAPLYREAGWRGVLPLPPAKKHPPLKGYTGHDGAWPTHDEMMGWIQDQPVCANLMLRINHGLIGIDVDAYDSKTGGRTLQEAERLWGPLPPTYRSSARHGDDISGIRIFRVPEGMLFRGVIKFPDLNIGDIEIVQPHHRFVVAWPSINPKNSQRYRWYAVAGSLMPEGQVPLVEDIPELPPAWVDALSRDAVRENVFDGSSSERSASRREQINEELYQSLIALQDDGVPDRVVERRLDLAITLLNDGSGSRYDTTRDHVAALMRLRAMGYLGVPNALERLMKAYVEAVTDTRPQVVAEKEFLRFTEGAAALVSATPAGGSKESEEAFWSQREILGSIRAYAWGQGVAPYAVLGAVLRRAIALVPPTVQIPAIVGDAVSVNLFTVSVGRSGQGKDAANGVARRAVMFVNADNEVVDDPPAAIGLGSGEGLAKALRQVGDDGVAPMHVNLEVPEINTLGALGDRKGATLIPELLKAYMGQALGFTNAQRSTTSYVPAHSYRLCLGVGAQPENAHVFLNREGDGLPQRFLWLPTIDPHAPAPTDEHREAVQSARVLIPTSFPSPNPAMPHHIGVPAAVRAGIKKHRHRVLTGGPDVDPLDGHLMLTRLKVGFGLALLDGRRQVIEEDWTIAGQLIDVSNRERGKLRRTMADRRRQANISRANDQADRQQIIDQRQMQGIHTRVWTTIKRKLSRMGRASRRDLQRACDSSIARDFPAVFDAALDDGRLLQIGEGRDAMYCLGSEKCQ